MVRNPLYMSTTRTWLDFYIIENINANVDGKVKTGKFQHRKFEAWNTHTGVG